jgi:hypothetical protein
MFKYCSAPQGYWKPGLDNQITSSGWTLTTIFHIEAALKFCRKSIALYETKDAVTFLRDLQEPSPTSSSSSSGARPSTPPAPQQPSPDPGIAKDDSERVATVRRIRACKATQYYEIMGLEKTCSDQDIKRAYRKVSSCFSFIVFVHYRSVAFSLPS